MRFEDIKAFGCIKSPPCSRLLLHEIAFPPYNLVLLLYVLVTVDFEVFPPDLLIPYFLKRQTKRGQKFKYGCTDFPWDGIFIGIYE